MLGLAVIFALILWIGLIILSVWLPLKIFKSNGTLATILAITGFMLTCGFWAIKWNMESIAAQKEAEKMCQQAGATIYVQPEKWKEMVGGEEAWKELGKKSKSWSNLTAEERLKNKKYIDFEGEQYEFSFQVNSRIASYNVSKLEKYGFLSKYIYYDTSSNTILYKTVSFYPKRADIKDGFKVLFFNGGRICKNQNNPFKDFIYIPTR